MKKNVWTIICRLCLFTMCFNTKDHQVIVQKCKKNKTPLNVKSR